MEYSISLDAVENLRNNAKAGGKTIVKRIDMQGLGYENSKNDSCSKYELMETIVVRRYRNEDRDCIRDIAWETAFQGEPAGRFFDDKEILADFLTLYFTDYESESCFVAEVNGKVIGYLIGATSAARLESIFITKIATKLKIKFLLSGAIFKKKNLIFLFHWLHSFIKGEFLKMRDFSKQYPAILHINLKKDFRGFGIGSRLIAAYLDYLIKKKISGVHLATMSDKAGEFFAKQGFILLYCGLMSYFRYILHKDTPIYIYGKKL